MTQRWRVRVDRDACIGAGACAAASKQFALDAGFQSSVVHEIIDPDAEVLSAARTCPVDAISITVVDSGESVYPLPARPTARLRE